MNPASVAATSLALVVSRVQLHSRVMNVEDTLGGFDVFRTLEGGPKTNVNVHDNGSGL